MYIIHVHYYNNIIMHAYNNRPVVSLAISSKVNSQLVSYAGSLIIVRGRKGEPGIHCNACAKLKNLCFTRNDD